MDSHAHLCRNSRGKKVYGPTFMHSLGQIQLPNSQEKAKKCAWKTWEVIPDTTETFINLSSLVERTEHGTEYANINKCCQYPFTRMSRSIENCPPASNVLEQHIKRSQIQASIWVNALMKEDMIVDPTHFICIRVTV